MGIVIAYMIVGCRISQLKGNLRQSGVEMAQKLATHSSLPLLELDIPALRALLGETSSSSSVICTAIIDYKNNIIVYNSAKPNSSFMPVDKGRKATTVGQMSIGEGLITDHEKIISFSSDVIYAGTKIGKIYLALSAAEIDKLKNRFTFIILLSFTLLLLVVVSLHYKDGGRRFITKMLKRRQTRDDAGRVVLTEMTRTGCPLCGSNRPMSQEVLNDVASDRFLILQLPNGEPGTTRFRQLKAISLSEVAKRQDLSWLKRQVILRCTEIIKKLAP